MSWYNDGMIQRVVLTSAHPGRGGRGEQLFVPTLGGSRIAATVQGLLIAWLVLVGLVLPQRFAAQEPHTVRLAVIGDYGDGSQAEADVAALVKSWSPDAVITTGDNNYPDGRAETIDRQIGRFYSDFIAPYQGEYGTGADVNRFFPTLGNHDWHTTTGTPAVPQPYLDYFALPEGPGQERYYDVVLGPVHVFAVDSYYLEPDDTASDSVQAAWLQERLAQSTVPWKLVIMHHPPYSSGLHGSTSYMRWPYQAWGATAVLAGHDHSYERIVQNGFLYFVNGLGGGSRYWFLLPVEGSQVRYSADAGAMLVEASEGSITFRFITRRGVEVDSYTIAIDDSRVPQPAVETGATPGRESPNPTVRPSQRRAIGT